MYMSTVGGADLCGDRLCNVESSFDGDDDDRPRRQVRKVVGELQVTGETGAK